MRSPGRVALVLALAVSMGTPTAVAQAADENHAPVAVDDPSAACGVTVLGGAFPIIEDWDEPFPFFGTCGLLANDYDVDGDALTGEIVTQPEHGSAEWFADGDVTWLFYEVDPDYSTRRGDVEGGTWVSDQLTYRVFDGQLWSEPATFSVWIAPVNDAPSFTPGPHIVVDQDSGPYSAQWATDIDPGPYEAYQKVSFEIVDVLGTGLDGAFAAGPAIGSDGVLTFTPGTHASGAATVLVRAVDDGGLEDWGQSPLPDPPENASEVIAFGITITPNAYPVIGADADLPVRAGSGPTRLDLLANDSDADEDALSVVEVTNGQHGTVAIVEDGAAVTYDPNTGYVGDDYFTYTIEDARGGRAWQYVTVKVSANAAPRAADDTVIVAQGAGPTVLNVLANDAEPDSDSLTVVSVTAPARGTAQVSSGAKSVVYDPTGLQFGSDAFEYTVSDGRGGTDTGLVKVTIARDTAPPSITGRTRSFPGQAIASGSSRLTLGWTGADAGTGIGSYRLEVRVNGGPFTAVPLATATSRSATVQLLTGASYEFRVRATDRAGNVGPFSSWPILTEARIQEGNAAVRYSAAWSAVSHSSLLRGAARYTGSTSRRAVVTFTGRDVALVGTRRTNGGRAQVLIDGIAVATVDLDAALTQYRRVLFTRAFASKATHTLEIRPLGDGRIEFDAVLVLR